MAAIPKAIDKTPKAEVAASQGRPECPAAGPPLCILVAEDDAVHQSVIVRMVESWGHTAVVVANGEAALAAMEETAFDLVLMDVEMPVMSGFEATARVRVREREARLPHTRIVALTAYAMKGDRERCLAAGMDEYLSKPISRASLFAVLQKLSLTSSNGEPEGPAAGSPASVKPRHLAFDRRAALDRLDGDEELLREVLDVFFDDTPKQLQILKDAIVRREVDVVVRQSHSLKGACLNVGAQVLGNLALEIEAACKRGRLTEMDSLIQDFERGFEHLRQVTSEPSRSARG
jgi:CheY-like chemotaxis protein/HPt (histidine-containing phosphotransfer) domain-containing protein